MQEVIESAKSPLNARGMFWVADESAFRRLSAAVPDPDVLGGSYSAWRKNSVRMFNRSNRIGEPRVQVVVNLNSFFFWCARKGIGPNDAARDRFAQIELERNLG
jgi:hypothetical protein